VRGKIRRALNCCLSALGDIALELDDRMAQRAALHRAVQELPTCDDGTWFVPPATLKVAGLEDDELMAKKYILKFSEWAREAISRLPPMPPADMQATDFNDYYKVVMSRVQLLYTQAQAGAARSEIPSSPVCQFETQLRRRPTFIQAGQQRTLACFDTSPVGSGPPLVGGLDESMPAFRTALRAVGARRFDATTLAQLLKSRDAVAAGIENSLEPVNDEWIAALDGKPLFTLLDEGTDFSNCKDVVEAKVVIQNSKVVVLVQGPWFRVTFCETPLLQCMSQFMTDVMISMGDDDGAAWCREAMFNFATVAHNVAKKTKKGVFSLFSGRRTPHPEFHILQHMYFAEALGGIPSSSLFAGRILGSVGRSPPLIGTLAHEGPMAFFALHPELDQTLPVSSILWHCLFWGCTSNHTILPDGFGSAAFKAMVSDLGLLELVSMARQDSGKLSRFAQIFPDTKKMASEIETFADVEEAMGLGFVACGAGGFFGEKRLTCRTEFSLAAKIVKAVSDDGKGGQSVGYAGKLGDATNSSGSWADYDTNAAGMPVKFIVSAEAPREVLWQRMLRYGRLGDQLHDRVQSGADHQPLLCKADAKKLAGHLRKLIASPVFAEARYSAIAERLTSYAVKVDCAAELLPDVPTPL